MKCFLAIMLVAMSSAALGADRQAAIDARAATIEARTDAGEAMESACQSRDWMHEKRLDALLSGNACEACGAHWTAGDGAKWLGNQRMSDQAGNNAVLHWEWGEYMIAAADADAMVQILELEQGIDLDGSHSVGDFGLAVALYQDAEVDYEDCEYDATAADGYYQTAADEYEPIPDCLEGEEE